MTITELSEYKDSELLAELVERGVKLPKLALEQRVMHDFSNATGTIKGVRSDPNGYDYYVKWDTNNRRDWYRSDVLLAVGPAIDILGGKNE